MTVVIGAFDCETRPVRVIFGRGGVGEPGLRAQGAVRTAARRGCRPRSSADKPRRGDPIGPTAMEPKKPSLRDRSTRHTRAAREGRWAAW